MKANFFKQSLIVAMLMVLVIACSRDESELKTPENVNNVEDVKDNNDYVSRTAICPPGTRLVISYNFEEFRFKRPKYNCESGFWFCTTGGEWEFSCEPSYSAVYKATELSKVDEVNSTTTVSGIVYLNNKTLDFYFPKELIGVGGNSSSDFDTFNVDENLKIADNVILKKGDYPSSIVGTEIIVTVEIL